MKTIWADYRVIFLYQYLPIAFFFHHPQSLCRSHPHGRLILCCFVICYTKGDVVKKPTSQKETFLFNSLHSWGREEKKKCQMLLLLPIRCGWQLCLLTQLCATLLYTRRTIFFQTIVESDFFHSFPFFFFGIPFFCVCDNIYWRVFLFSCSM